MPLHRLIVTQVYRTERRIVVEVEADTLEDAVDQQQQEDAPAYGNPSWRETVNLQSEEVDPSSPAEERAQGLRLTVAAPDVTDGMSPKHRQAAADLLSKAGAS